MTLNIKTLFLLIRSSSFSSTDDFITGFSALGNLVLNALLNPSFSTSCVYSMYLFCNDRNLPLSLASSSNSCLTFELDRNIRVKDTKQLYKMHLNI